MNKEKMVTISKKIAAVFVLPLLIYLVMMIVCGSNGQVYNIFSYDAFSSILKKTSYMAIVALGIGFQLKYGRFDFSGGAIIVVSAIIAGVAANATGLGPWFLILIAIISGMALSAINSLIYTTIRIPISVCSLAVAYLFEAFSGVILHGKTGPGILYMEKYNVIGTFPVILIFIIAAIAIYVVYDKFTVAGRQSKLLRENQHSAVNIGINEKKNTLIAYLVSGAIFGLAGAIYCVQNPLESITSPLQTSGTLFSNIIPSLVGLFLARYIDDSAGTFIGALTISILYYGLDLIGVKSGAKTLSYASFLCAFILISGFWDQIIGFIRLGIERIKGKFKKDRIA